MSSLYDRNDRLRAAPSLKRDDRKKPQRRERQGSDLSGVKVWRGTRSNRRHEDFQSDMARARSVTIGRQLNEFKRLRRLRFRSICRFKPIRANGPGKVVTKQISTVRQKRLERG